MDMCCKNCKDDDDKDRSCYPEADRPVVEDNCYPEADRSVMEDILNKSLGTGGYTPPDETTDLPDPDSRSRKGKHW